MEANEKDIFEPLKISCDNADCENNLHCFRKSKPRNEIFPEGTCKYCGADLINWDRIYKKQIRDAKYVSVSLKKEWIRHHFWHTPLPQKAINYALKKGKENLKIAIQKRIKSSIAPSHPFRDGYQTPFESNNPIHYAQHATATCCRKCVEYWYGIDYGKELTNEEIDFLVDIILYYFQERIVNLTDQGQNISNKRGQNGQEDSTI